MAAKIAIELEEEQNAFKLKIKQQKEELQMSFQNKENDLKKEKENQQQTQQKNQTQNKRETQNSTYQDSKIDNDSKISSSAEIKIPTISSGRGSERGSEKDLPSRHFTSESKGENLNRVDDSKYGPVRAAVSVTEFEYKSTARDSDIKGTILPLFFLSFFFLSFFHLFFFFILVYFILLPT